MGNSRQRGRLGPAVAPGIWPARTPGPLGVRDQADYFQASLMGDTPGPLGINDHASPPQCIAPAAWTSSGRADEELSESSVSGSVPIGIGSAGLLPVVRIPVPGGSGLFVELNPRGFVPKGGSTSTVFIQDATGRKHLRLDYGYNTKSGKVDYHWNQKGTFDKFKIPDHATSGQGGEALYKGAKYLKYGGRVLLVVGLVTDAVSIVQAKKKLRQVLRVAAGWGGAALGCKALGAGGAAVGTIIEPGGGTAVGGIAGCLVGSVGGYLGASWAAGEAYDYVEETYFEELPETPAAPGASALVD